MQCHHCGEEAAVPVEKDGIKVWLCERHLRERFAKLADAETTEELESILTE